MALLTKSLVSLRSKNLTITFYSGYETIEVTELSDTIQANTLMKTTIQITELQELSVTIRRGNAEQVTIHLPEMKAVELTDEMEQTIDVYSFGQSNIYPWSNGKYIYKIIVDDVSFYGVLHVQAKNITTDEFTNMHKYLESKLSGISRKYTELAKVIQPEVKDQPPMNALEHWLIKKGKELATLIYMIERGSVSTYKKSYHVERIPKHLDRKSIQWAHGKKGSIHAGQRHLNRKYERTANSAENRYVKRCTLTILKQMKEFKLSIKKQIKSLDGKIQERARSVTLIERSYSQAQLARNISKQDLYRQQNSLKNGKRDLQQKQGLAKQLGERFNNLNSNYQKLNYLMNNSFWKYVPYNQSRPIRLTNNSYILFQKLWTEFLQVAGHKQGRPGDVSRESQDYSLRSTPTLYEYYTYFKLSDLLQQQGFTITKQQRGLMPGSIFSELLPNTILQFTKGQTRIDLVYEQEVHVNPMNAKESKTYFFSRANSRRPDIRMDLYIYNEELAEYLYDSSKVVEVKYRPLGNIHSDLSFTKEMEQMNNYRLMTRYCPIREEYLYGVREVICVYPGSSQQISFTSEVGVYVTLRPTREAEFDEYMTDNFLAWQDERVKSMML